MINATAVFTEKEQDFQNEQTTYWFMVQSEDDRIESGEYGVVHSPGGEEFVYDDGGEILCPAEITALSKICVVTGEMIQDF